MPRKIPVGVALPPEMYERIQALAEGCHRTKAAYIRQIIRRYLKYLDTMDDPEAGPIDWRIDDTGAVFYPRK